jgi:hypothetical protein
MRGMMTILEKLQKKLPLDKEELEKERTILLVQLTKIKQLTNKLTKIEKQELDNSLSLLMLYFPEDWKEFLFKGLGDLVVSNLIDNEKNII